MTFEWKMMVLSVVDMRPEEVAVAKILWPNIPDKYLDKEASGFVARYHALDSDS